tara:strand:+ start:185 stop:1276 length:1092 start_codon:yes stop_codon:yes gene_type:complete
MSREQKHIHTVKELISKFNLDLSKKIVMTECASKGYAFTPIIAALSGAESVLAVGSDSRFGKFDNNKKNILNLAEIAGVNSSVFKFVERRYLDSFDLSKIDIITNSGQLRPISSSIIYKLKETAVISLMWETWEFRHQDIDLRACQEKNILVIGTNENFPEISMYGYNPFIVLRLMFDLGIEIHNNKIILLGGGNSGTAAFKGLENLGLNVLWFTKKGDNNSLKYSELNKIYDYQKIDVIINFEHDESDEIIGKKGFLSFKKLKTKFPFISYGHICGQIDIDELKSSGIDFLPKKILPFGYMSYQTINLGYRPVLELVTAGLKVGEIAANERLSGASIEKAIQKSIDYGIGQDFKGGFLNYRV